MEKPVQLKQSSKSKSIKHSNGSGKQCIIHFQSTVNEEVQLLTDKGFYKLQDVAKTRLSYNSAKYRLEHLSCNLPDTFDVEKHGTHKRCYQLFTNVSHVPKRVHPNDSINETPSKRSKCNLVLYPADKCIFCDKNVIKIKGCKQNLTKCVTKCAEDSIKLAASEKSDSHMLCKIEGQDLVAREAMYHNTCRRSDTRSVTRHESHEGSDASIQQTVHNIAFRFICEYIEEHIVVGHNVERLTMLKERYLGYILKHHPSEYNENYKTYKLKNKLSKHFQDKIQFWKPKSCNTTSELVYGAGLEGSAVEKAFELAASDERRLAESAMILRRYVLECRQNSTTMPWPPSANWLLSGERQPPRELINFFINLISAKTDVSKCVSTKVQRYAKSFAEDVCYAISNGQWLMPKHILLPMTVRHLTGNAELITILNRFGHGQSYTRTMELETAMCNAVVNSPTTLPAHIAKENNAVIHFCWDNFDLNEETPSGAGTTHSTHGIVLQEVADTSIEAIVEPYQVPKSGERTVRPKELYMRPCFAKPKVEPSFETQKREPEFSPKPVDLNTVIWSLCRVLGISFEQQTVPSITGWLSKTAVITESVQTTVEYMPPINASNETSTVQHILETSIIASQEVVQKYTIVTFDLAVAKKAYSLCWQFKEEYNKVIVRMGVFHTVCSLFSTLGKMLKCSGFAEIVIEAGICASGSIDKVMSGRHYNRTLRVHKLVVECLDRLLLKRFEEQHPQPDMLCEETMKQLHDLARDPDCDKLRKVAEANDILEYFNSLNMFKESIRAGQLGKTAQFWLNYMDIIHMILTLIRATKENDLQLHIAALYNLCPLYFAFDHHNYARYVPAYLMTLMNLEKTHPGATELLESNGISVCRSSVPKSRNPVDITIEQTINRHAKCQGGIVGFSRNYSAYYRWSTTRHFRAQYVEAVLQTADIASEESSVHKELQPSQLHDSELSVQKVLDSVCNFTNPFDIDTGHNELYCLSSGVPAKPDAADNLLHATEIGRAAMMCFITDRLVDKKVSFHDPIKRNKLKTFATSEVSKTIQGSHNKIAQIKAERNIFAQLVLLAVQNDIDLEQTLSYPLGPVAWSLATADGMPVRTNKAKLLHHIETGIEPTTVRPTQNVAHVLDGNAILQSIVSVPNTFEEVAQMVFDQLPKSGRVAFVTDTYNEVSIKSLERSRRGTSPTFLLSGPKTKTPRDWKSFMSNNDNKTQLLNLLLEQWSNDIYAEKLKNRLVYFVLGEKCCRLTSHDGETVEVLPEESLFSSQEEADTRIILHCLHITETDTETETIVVRSPDTDVIVLLVRYWSQFGCSVLFDTGSGNKRRLIDVGKIVNTKGADFCEVLPAIHCFTGCDTVSAFVRRWKVGPAKLLEKHTEYFPIFAKLGENTECTDELMLEIEHFVCHMYGKPIYTDINKLRFDTFCKKSDIKGNTLSSCNSIDMSLLPPCETSLKMHIKRTNYQLYIWVHAHERYPQTPDIQNSGWKIGTEGIEYIWTDGAIVPSELADILCKEGDDVITDESDEEDSVEIDNTLDEVFVDE